MSQRPLRLTTIGPTGVGKTTLLQKFVQQNNKNDVNVQPTVGVEFTVKRCNDPEFGESLVEIWDTSGQERYYALSYTYIRSAAALLIVYDASVAEENAMQAVQEWYERVRQCRNDFSAVPLAVAGNKVDLVPSSPRHTQVQNWCVGLGIPHFYTSGLDGNGCALPFEDLVHRAQALKYAQTLDEQTRRNSMLSLRLPTREANRRKVSCPCF